MQEQLIAAYELADLGLRLFPLKRDGKLPAIEDWQDKATDDPFALAEWFASSKRNIGVATGQSGLIVLDTDQKHGVDGDANLRLLAAEYGFDIDNTFTVRSPTGSLHYYFRGSLVRNSAGKLAPGVDIRSKGGLVVAPGSLIGGAGYEIVRRSPIADAPTKLVECISHFYVKAEPAKLASTVELDTAAALATAEIYLRDEAPPAVEGNGGNDTTYRVACRMRDLGVSEIMTGGMMLAGWNERCSPPWTDEELAAVVSNAYQYAENSPGSASAEIEFDDLGDIEPTEQTAKASPGRISVMFGPQIQAGGGQRRQYIIKGILAEGDLGIIFGKPGAGKSLLAPYLGACIAKGEPAFGHRTQQCKVLYVAAEDAMGMAARIDALQRQIGVAENLALVSGVSNLTAKGSEDLAALIGVVKEHRPKVIIIDTLSMAFPGLDENSSEGMGRVVEVCRGLSKSGAAVILIHHDTKAEGDTPRGHSLLDGALDMKLKLTRDEATGVIAGKLGKNRNGSLDWYPAFKIGISELGIDSDGDKITAAYADVLDRAPPTATQIRIGRMPKLKPTAKAALDILVELDEETGGAGVDRKAWRARCCDTATAVSAADDYRSRVRAWQRSLEDLLRANLLTLDDGYVLLAGDARDFEILKDPPFDENKIEKSG